jgi:segregation and condensation protein B
MNTPADPSPTPRELGESMAAQLGNQEWELDAEDLLTAANSSATPENANTAEPGQLEQPELHDSDSQAQTVPLAEAAVEPEIPPTPLQIIEAMLFIGGQPLKAEKACEIVRGLGVEQFRESIDVLNRVYRLQNRPYFVAASEQGYSMAVRPRYRSIREKIFGGPREARLTHAALDVLALIAYQQPAAKNEIDTVRGVESGHIIRQLIRLGLISVVQRADSDQREVCYGTTTRFLELFNLKGLDDLPRTGDPQRLWSA